MPRGGHFSRLARSGYAFWIRRAPWRPRSLETFVAPNIRPHHFFRGETDMLHEIEGDCLRKCAAKCEVLAVIALHIGTVSDAAWAQAASGIKQPKKHPCLGSWAVVSSPSTTHLTHTGLTDEVRLHVDAIGDGTFMNVAATSRSRRATRATGLGVWGKTKLAQCGFSTTKDDTS